MTRGIEALSSGMQTAIDLNDVLANNVANASSNGFKKSNAVIKRFDDVMVDKLNNMNYKNYYDGDNKYVGQISSKVETQQLYVDFTQGSLVQTSNPLDVAINGDGFFTVQKSNNQTAYTRNGSFLLGQDGILKDAKGNAVIGELDKPIKISKEQAKNISINRDGTIMSGLEKVNKLKIVDFQDRNMLTQQADSLFINDGNSRTVVPKNLDVNQGMLESSNSSIVQEMVNSISGMRAYETMATMMKMTDGTLQKNINDVGRLAR